MNLAIIPARGGSKRIPGKNIRSFAGKPMIAYSIDVALESGLFEHVWVSTDSEEIANVALQYGADVPFIRPEALSDDYIGTYPVVNHAISYANSVGIDPKFTCCIYATAPLIQRKYLIEGFERLRSEPDMDFAFSVTSFAFPIQRAIRLSGKGVRPFEPGNMAKRSQDLEEAYHDAGQFYWGYSKSFINNKSTFSEQSIPIILPRHLVQDIDTAEDWQRAELMFHAYMQGVKCE
ncbi:pseudaminic acid cytidylyltransferase [Aestuariibacter salexigens]|uniref:pseudaminic acid cytidylyltransferase n=1 Tax=Aestuariibacter salexigens TaxID=226010 RepID=UPI000410C938|nr:pseudaminic acid cytidylyltransferase [Aestuariibacter salexigens]